MLKVISYYRKSSEKDESKDELNQNDQVKAINSYLKQKKGGRVICPKQ